MYSAVILTLNEEQAISGCLDSLSECRDIVVVDSGSSDRTVAIASAAGARVFTRSFDSFAGQRNFADREIPFRNPWVMHLDADERMTPELSAECIRATSRDDIDGFRVAPKMIFEGRWIPHCTDYPAFQARMVRVPGFEFIQVGHGQREAAHMRMENLSESYLHDLSMYGQEDWLAKHRRYAKAEASRVLSERPAGETWRGLLSPDPLVRRRALKRLSFALPFRPAMRFTYQYGLRRGFLDGRSGLHYCRLLARYEGFISDEIHKLKQSVRRNSLE